MDGSELEEFDVEKVAQKMTDGEPDPGCQNVENDAFSGAAKEKMETCSVSGRH